MKRTWEEIKEYTLEQVGALPLMCEGAEELPFILIQKIKELETEIRIMRQYMEK